jgi:acetylornithine aminotransferase
MTSHYDLSPDMMVLGKGLGGGLYPVSAVLTTGVIYDRCMNEGHWGFASSMACSPIAALVATTVVEIIQRPALLANVRRLETSLAREFAALCEEFPSVFMPGSVLGAMATLGLRTTAIRDSILPALFRHGVMCHSVSLIEPAVVKFFPCLTSDDSVVAELCAALRRCAFDVAGTAR